MSGRARLLAIRPGEGRMVALVAALFLTVEAGRGVGEVAADTLFLSRFGAGALPILFIALGPVSAVVALGYGAGIGRRNRRAFLVALLTGSAAALVIERVALDRAGAVLPVLWLTVYALGAILMTLLWTVALTTFDARQAKRLFPLCTAAAILGGFVGTLGAGPLARVIGVQNLLLLYAALLFGAAALTAATVDRFGRPGPPPGPQATFATHLRAGFDSVRGSPLLRLVAVAYVLFAVLMFSVTFPFLTAMGEAFPSEGELATALGLLAAAVTGVSFLVSIALARRLYAAVGVAGAALLLPVVYLGGFALWLVHLSLATVVLVRFAQQVTQRGVSNAAWSTIYHVLPADRRPQALAFIDGVPGQLGTSLSGVLLLGAGALLAPAHVPALGALAALVTVGVVLRIRARYGQALVATLRAGLAEQVLAGGPGLVALAQEPHVLPGLRRALTAAAPGSRRLAADLLGRLGATDAAPDLVALLDDPEPEVRIAAIGGLAALDPRLLDGHGDRLARDPHPEVRAELAVALADERASRPILAALLASSASGDRVAALEALARMAGHGFAEEARAACGDGAPAVRAAGVRALATAPGGPLGPLLGALDDEAPGVRVAASAALAGRSDAVPPLRTWALRLVARAAELREHAMVAGPSPTAGEAFLCFLLEHRQREIEQRLLSAVAALGAPEADGPVRRALRSADPEVRAQAVEALDALGDRRLRRALVQLLDGDGRARPMTDGAIRSLAGDPDPWIRALATRTLRERAADDGSGGRTMPDTEQTLAAIDRMLLLRGVPLFARLAPEDLQRIAASASERLYAAGEALVVEGDVGDEMVVLVEGDVTVVDSRGGDTRVIRAYQAGDHIGELAVLRERPRAATVIAGASGVRGLVIGGEALRAVLRERPDAAMAMLRTLADRISEQ